VALLALPCTAGINRLAGLRERMLYAQKPGIVATSMKPVCWPHRRVTKGGTYSGAMSSSVMSSRPPG
jgi:hypothetical protein